MSEDRIKELEAELARTRSLLDERNKISGNLTLQLKKIAAVVFQDYPLEDDFARLVSAVESLRERQVSVPFMSALQHWLDAMERRSTTSITKADTRLANQARAWFSQTVDRLRVAATQQRDAVSVLLELPRRIRQIEDLSRHQQGALLRSALSECAEDVEIALRAVRLVSGVLPTLEQLKHGWDSTQGEQKPWQWAHELLREYATPGAQTRE